MPEQPLSSLSNVGSLQFQQRPSSKSPVHPVVQALLFVLFLMSIPSAQAQIISTDEILGLLRAGVSEEVILFKIRDSKSWLELDSKDILLLREAGASDKFLLDALRILGRAEQEAEEALQASASSAESATGFTLFILSEPSGASIVIDGIPVEGRTPFVGNKLEPGRHEVYLSKRYYRPLSRSIQAKRGEKVQLQEKLSLERLGLSVMVHTRELGGRTMWAVRGRSRCPGGGEPVVREGKEEERVILRAGNTPLQISQTCVDVYFWLGRVQPESDGRAPQPDAIFKLDGIPLDRESLAHLDLLIERNEMSPTRLKADLLRGSARIQDPFGSGR